MREPTTIGQRVYVFVPEPFTPTPEPEAWPDDPIEAAQARKAWKRANIPRRARFQAIVTAVHTDNLINATYVDADGKLQEVTSVERADGSNPTGLVWK